MEKKLQNIYLTYYNLLTVQDLLQAHYQVLSIIYLKELKFKYGHDDKKCETCGIKYKYCNCFLEYRNFKNDQIE